MGRPSRNKESMRSLAKEPKNSDALGRCMERT
jgi:hypothetical protein